MCLKVLQLGFGEDEMAYTKEEINGFEEKDRRIVLQSSLDRATQIVLTIHKDVGETNTVNRIKEIAKEFYEFVWNTALIKQTVPPETKTEHPVPTQKQAELLEKIKKYLVEKAVWKNDVKVEEFVWTRYKSYPMTQEAAKKMAIELGKEN